MAATYTIAATGVSFAANKSMVGIFNGSGSGQIFRVYRIWALNNQITAVTGVMTNIEIRRISAGSGGNAITPLKHDSTNSSFPAQVIVASAMTVTDTDLFRRIVWSTDEPVANATATLDELQTIPALLFVSTIGAYNVQVRLTTSSLTQTVNIAGGSSSGITEGDMDLIATKVLESSTAGRPTGSLGYKASLITGSGLSTSQELMLLEMYQLLGLDPTKPLVVTTTSRTAGTIEQTISGDPNTTVTVQRV